MKLYLHINDKGKTETFIHQVDQEDATLEELIKEVLGRLNKDLDVSRVRVATTQNGKRIQNPTMLLSSFFAERDDVFISFDEANKAPIATTVQPVKVIESVEDDFLKYEPLKKYTFYEFDDWNVRVLIELPDIHLLPPEKITSRFFERSFELKIKDFKGKNYNFAVPKTNCKLNYKDSRHFVKNNKIYINIRKDRKEDGWFSLYKQRTIGGDDD